MSKPRRNQTIQLERPRCPYCANAKYLKTAGAWRTVEHPTGAVSKLYRVKCAGCRQNFNLREITPARKQSAET